MPKPEFYPISAKTTKNNFAQGVAYEPEALTVPALGGLVYLMSNLCGNTCQNWCGSIIQTTVSILITVLDQFLLGYFGRQG